MFPNPDAMLLIMQAGDPTSIDMEADAEGDRYERLFAARDRLVSNNAEVASGRQVELLSQNDILMGDVLTILENDFPEMPEEDQRDLAAQIIAGVLANPREIEDLSETQLLAIEDVAVNMGVMRTLLFSYGIQLSDEFANSPRWMGWITKYQRYLVI